jgi:hypothetical protein
MNDSTVHSLFSINTPRNYNVGAKTNAIKKLSVVLHYEVEVGEYLLLSDSEESLSYLKSDNDNELEDHALLDVVVNEGSDDDDNIIRDFVWENMKNYKGQKENFMGSVGPQGAAKHVTEIVDVLKCFQ